MSRVVATRLLRVVLQLLSRHRLSGLPRGLRFPVPDSKVGDESVDEGVVVQAAKVCEALLKSCSEGGGVVAGVRCCLGMAWRHAQ